MEKFRHKITNTIRGTQNCVQGHRDTSRQTQRHRQTDTDRKTHQNKPTDTGKHKQTIKQRPKDKTVRGNQLAAFANEYLLITGHEQSSPFHLEDGNKT